MCPRMLPAVLLLTAVGCGQPASPEPVLIGMIQLLSGPAQTQGQGAINGARLALERLRDEEKTINGRPLTILHADAGGGPNSVRSEAVRLISVNRTPAVIGVLDGEGGEVFLREARLLSAPALLAGEAPTAPTGEGSLALTAGPQARAKVLAQFLRDNLKPTRVAMLLDERDPIAAHLIPALARHLRAAPAVPVQEVRYSSDEKRAAALKQVVDGKPDVVVLGVPLAVQPALLASLKGHNYTGPTVNGSSDSDPSDSISTTPEKHYHATIYAGTDLTARGQAFKQAYQERFGSDPPLSAVLSWEAVLFLAESMGKQHSASSLRLRETFGKEAGYEGIAGPVTFQGRLAVRKLFIVSEAEGKRSVERAFSPGE